MVTGKVRVRAIPQSILRTEQYNYNLPNVDMFGIAWKWEKSNLKNLCMLEIVHWATAYSVHQT